jgi:hypothetical protein
MKTRLIVVLVGLATSFTLPILASQKDAVNPQLAQQIRVLAAKYGLVGKSSRAQLEGKLL